MLFYLDLSLMIFIILTKKYIFMHEIATIYYFQFTAFFKLLYNISELLI